MAVVALVVELVERASERLQFELFEYGKHFGRLLSLFRIFLLFEWSLDHNRNNVQVDFELYKRYVSLLRVFDKLHDITELIRTAQECNR